MAQEQLTKTIIKTHCHVCGADLPENRYGYGNPGDNWARVPQPRCSECERNQ